MLKNVYESAVNKHGVEVKVGMKLTKAVGTDRYPFTVIGVSQSGGTLIVQEDGYDMSSFDYKTGNANPKRNKEGNTDVVRLTRKSNNGYLYKNVQRYVLGSWNFYQDPNF